MFWCGQNQSLTTAALCLPLHCHQLKWTLFENGKVGKFDMCCSTISKKADRGRETERGCTPCVLQSSLFFFTGTRFILPVESAMSRCSLWLTSHPDHPADYICSAVLSAKETDRKGRDRAYFGEKRLSWLSWTHIHPFNWVQVFLHRRTLSAVSGINIVFVSLSTDLWIPVHVPYLPASTLVRKWCRLGHLSPDNEAVVPFSSLYSSLANCSRSLLLSLCDQGN